MISKFTCTVATTLTLCFPALATWQTTLDVGVTIIFQIYHSLNSIILHAHNVSFSWLRRHPSSPLSQFYVAFLSAWVNFLCLKQAGKNV